MRLQEIGRLDIRDWRADVVKQTTPYVANAAVRVLSAALGAAVEDGLLLANPCQGLRRLPGEAVNRRTPATLIEVETIRAHLEKPEDRVVISLMAYAGLRPAEVRSLRWEDVRVATLVVRSADGTEGEEKTTKTGGIRAVPILAPLAEDLAALDRVGPLVVGRRIDWDNWTARVWRPARDSAGATVQPYALRHTYASLLIAEGRTAHEVAPLLGHSTPQLTFATYGHLFAEAQLSPDESIEDAAARARAAASIPFTSAVRGPKV